MHGAGDDVFRGDQLDVALLAVELLGDCLGDLWIGFGELSLKKPGNNGAFAPALAAGFLTVFLLAFWP